MNENKQNEETQKSTIRRNWMPIMIMVVWVANMILGGIAMVNGNFKDASSFYLSSNMFALFYINFFSNIKLS